MTYLFGHFGNWMIVAGVLGLIVGLVAARRLPGYSLRDGWFWMGAYAIVIVAGILIALMKARGLRGLDGLRLEAALLLAVPYYIGCLIGALLRGGPRSETEQQLAAVLGAPMATAAEPARAGSMAAFSPAADPAPKAPANLSATPSSNPPASPALADEDKHPGSRPAGWVHALAHKPDNLKLISGIGKQNERRLNELGIWHFSQIAVWTPENVHWVGSYLAFPGRIDREHWIEQARHLAAGEMSEFAQRAARGEVSSSRDD